MNTHENVSETLASNSSNKSFNLRYIDVDAGVRLGVIDKGAGDFVVIIPGWSQTALEWMECIDHLADKHRVLAIDMRGHGASSKPQHGYHISRLAADLHAVFELENVGNITLVGHSMGCSVIWSYLELFGSERVKKLVLIDQGAMVLADPNRTEAQQKAAGAVFTIEVLQQILEGLRGPDAVGVTTQMLQPMISQGLPAARFDHLAEQNLLMPRDLAAEMLYDHAFINWTNVIRRIHLPTLVIGAKASIIPWQGMIAIGDMIRGSKTVIFEADEGGSHFMFIENPTKLLTLLDEFLENGDDV